MAYDPEARQNSNTAMILGGTALVLLLGAIAYFATRRAPTETVDSTVVVTATQAPATNTTIIKQAPAATPATVVVRQPTPAVRVERSVTNTNTTTVVRQPAAPAATAPGGAPDARSSTNTNVTVNVPPPGNTNTGGPVSANRPGGANAQTQAATPIPTAEGALDAPPAAGDTGATNAVAAPTPENGF